MSSLDPEIVALGDRLQVRWRADALRARRRRAGGLAGAALGLLLAVTGGAIAEGVLPIQLHATSARPSAAALSTLHALVDAPPHVPSTWKGAPRLQVERAIALGKITGTGRGPLAVFAVPVATGGACVDAARANGSSFLAACARFPLHATTVAGRRVRYFQIGAEYDGGKDGPPLRLLLRSAPPGAVRVDVRTRNGARLQSVLAHGWMVFVDPEPVRPLALVRFYDRAGRRILSFYG
ncbi:MAG TPA: hypothetical protein VGF46_08505 [Gaiellales bacterium]